MRYYIYKTPAASFGLSYVMAGKVCQCNIIKEDGEEMPEYDTDDIVIIYKDAPTASCTMVLKCAGHNSFFKIIEVAPGARLDDLPDSVRQTVESDGKYSWEITEEEYKQIVTIMTGSIGLIPANRKSQTMRNSKQIIFYGTPGSGKSHKVKEDYDNMFPKHQVIRTTFHPDTDYATFVGGYKPVTKIENGREIITYGFVPQSFTKAYVRAWNDLGNPYFLIIEEINRGNCAQIFGDIFQLLDRGDDGYSDYPIEADTDLRKYLEEGVDGDGNPILSNDAGIRDGKLCLPPNLSLIATMNTSDQSLFPMDTAFKRRWSWEYVPIEYDNEVSGQFKITIGEESFKWSDFLPKINERIKKLTSSEDKQMGNFFIRHSVGEKEFVNKVMFYLWSEIAKDNYQTSDRLFVCHDSEDGSSMKDFSFNELYEEGGQKKLLDFIHIILDEQED